jgi:hypothetical protein
VLLRFSVYSTFVLSICNVHFSFLFLFYFLIYVFRSVLPNQHAHVGHSGNHFKLVTPGPRGTPWLNAPILSGQGSWTAIPVLAAAPNFELNLIPASIGSVTASSSPASSNDSLCPSVEYLNGPDSAIDLSEPEPMNSSVLLLHLLAFHGTNVSCLRLMFNLAHNLDESSTATSVDAILAWGFCQNSVRVSVQLSCKYFPFTPISIVSASYFTGWL